MCAAPSRAPARMPHARSGRAGSPRRSLESDPGSAQIIVPLLPSPWALRHPVRRRSARLPATASLRYHGGTDNLSKNAWGLRMARRDPLGAFFPLTQVTVHGADSGPLAGLSFAAKDLFDVKGKVTGAGNPSWLATHGPARATAPAVVRLLGAGARLAGKTITDELGYSLSGENAHYGTPLNPRAPLRVPGGSSSGSASAVAGRVV